MKQIEAGDQVTLGEAEAGHVIPAGTYTVSKVNPDGSFHVGGNTAVWPSRVLKVSPVAQKLEVANPLGMFDGCYAKRRDGDIVGPWTWDGSGKRVPGWYCDGLHRFSNGRWSSDGAERYSDLVAVVPAPLPEPIERFILAKDGKPLAALWEQGDVEYLRSEKILGACTAYRVRIEFLEEVKL